MSQPKRYSVAVNDPWFGNGAYVAEDGKYVLHSDYAALAAENERLRKAGDAMAKSLAFEYPNSPKVAAWNAAKEGGDAK